MTTDLEALRDADGFYPDDIAEIIANANPEKKAMLKKIGKAVFEHSRYQRAWQWLEDILLESGTALEASCGLLYGASGVGKSTVLRLFAKQFGGPYQTRSGLVRPVLRVSTPPDPNLGNLLDAILRSLDADELIIGDNGDKKLAVISQLALQHGKVILFDEFTHIVEDRSEKFTKKAARELKEVLSEGRCQCVFAGTGELINLHNIYGQFRRRSGGDFEMTSFDWEDDDDQAEWIGVMESLDDILPIKSRIPLNDFAMAENLHRASDGIMDHVMKLLLRTTAFAYDYGDDHLERDVFSEAFERLRRGNVKLVNPFGAPRKRIVKPRVIEDNDEDSGLWSRGSGPKETFTK